MVDYLVVGAGLSGATFAQQAFEAGKTVIVIDKRDHIAGNCFTQRMEDIDVHMYGPHLFHTSSKDIWSYVNRFTEFNTYKHTVMARTANGAHALPINLHTFNSVLGIKTPEGAYKYLDAVREDAPGTDVESWCLRTIGRELYELFIRDYTIKQWGTDPSKLSESIIKRLPLRFTYNLHYFQDTYEGVPVDGYTQMVARMLEGITVLLNVDYIQDMDYLRPMARKVVYTGPLDRLFGNMYGPLPYRSVHFQHEWFETADVMGIGQTNFTSLQEEYTRIVEHKHFNPRRTSKTIVTKEYASSNGEPYYPINNEYNDNISQMYQRQAASEGYIVCGRLANYRYYDMHQAIGQALKVAKEELSNV